MKKIQTIVLYSAFFMGACNYSIQPSRADLEHDSEIITSKFARSLNDVPSTDRRNIIWWSTNLKKQGLLEAESADACDLHYLTFVGKDINQALACLRVQMETVLRRMALPTCTAAPPNCISDLLAHLQFKKVLNSRQVDALGKLTTLLNDGAHGRCVATPEIEEWLTKESPKLISTLIKFARVVE